MSTKTIPFRQPGPLAQPADTWVDPTKTVPEATAPKIDGPTKRLTVDVPEALHRRIKIDCATNGTQISDVVRAILETKYPAGQ